jgi:hypothetical protein
VFGSLSERETSLTKSLKLVVAAIIAILTLATASRANTRTLETRFALSADLRSEFSTRFPLLSAGRIVVEANWDQLSAAHSPASLRMILIQPNGKTAATKSGSSILRLEYQATEQDMQTFGESDSSRWIVKILNDADENRREVAGIVRITVPIDTRALEDTQFTLVGSGNAEEIPFIVPAPGKVEVDATWEPDVSSKSSEVTLVVSLIHPGEAKTIARRQGLSPVRVEHQVTEEALDRGGRWIVRIQNDTQTKVRGRVKVTYSPSL